MRDGPGAESPTVRGSQEPIPDRLRPDRHKGFVPWLGRRSVRVADTPTVASTPGPRQGLDHTKWLSVLTPSLNYAHFIGDTINSVLAQRLDNVEHIIRDGGSTDWTVKVLRDFGDAIVWTSEPDAGQADALNRALSCARGQWVSWLNADEFYLPGGVQVLRAAATTTRADVVYGDCVFVDRNGRFIRLLPQHPFDLNILRWYGCFIPTCAAIMRREVLGDTPWDTELKRIMDWDLYLRLASEGARFTHVPFPVGAFRIHDARVTSAPLSQSTEERRMVMRRYSIPDSTLVRILGRYAHRVDKLRSGAYRRQVSARGLRHADLRWFDTAVGRLAFDKLLAKGYALPPPTGPLGG